MFVVNAVFRSKWSTNFKYVMFCIKYV